MAGKIFGSDQEFQAISSLHGVPSSSRTHGEQSQRRQKTRIEIPKQGSTPNNNSSSRQSVYGHSRRSSRAHKPSSLPRHHANFFDNLHQEDKSHHGNSRHDNDIHDNDVEIIPHDDGPHQTARRGGWRSPETGRRAPSPHNHTQAHADRTSSGVLTVEIPAKTSSNTGTGKGKGKAREVDTSANRESRSKSSRKPSHPEEAIQVSDTDDEEIEPEFSVTSGKQPLRRRPLRQSQSRTSHLTALQVKDRRLKKEAETLSPAHPNNFYSRSDQRRVEGPVRLEEPDEHRNSASRASALVLSGESPEREEWYNSIPQSTRKASGSLVDRMKPRPGPSSPNALATSQQRSPNGFASKSPPSPARSQGSQAKRESSSSGHEPATNGTAQTLKRKRTETAHRSPGSHAYTEPHSLPIQVRLEAVVVSDIWRSRDDGRPLALFNINTVRLLQNSEIRLQIPYGDIRRVEASNESVHSHGILSLTLRPESPSAKRLQEVFSEFDPRASGEAAAIHLIARDQADDLLAHKRGVDLIHRKLNGLHTGDVNFNWLVQSAAKSKVGIVAGVKQLPWPQQPSSSSRLPAPQQPLSSRMPASQQSSSSRLTEAVAAPAPASEKSRRTLIVPGQGRDQDNEVRQTARSSSASGPQGQQKKTFDIQPASPKSAAGGTVDVDMADARPSSRSPPLPALTVARNRPTTTYAVPVSEPRREVNFPPHTPILQYPYEGIGAVTVLVSDFDRLQDGQLLNDTVIEFGLKFIHGCIRDRDPDLADSIHIFNTFFYKLLSATTVENSYRKLRKWTTKVDLFSKKYIVVPINEDYHWYLALIVNPHFMLMEQDQDNDSASEQDKEEVASALTAAPKASPSPPGPSAAPAKEDVQDVVEDADLEQHREAKSAPSSEPGTPPLPKLQLPLRSSQADAGSATVPMDVDTDSHAGKPSESAPEPVDLNRTFVITFDSLGSKHLKVKNKLHEYLWREALDKKRLSLDDLAKRMAKQEAEQAARREAEKPQTRAKEAAQKDEADDAADVSMDEAMDGATEATNAGKRKNAGVDEGSVRKIQIQDTRRVTGSDGAKPMDEETLAKYLLKTAYVHAQVPTQPNFCDCGIYLLHYVDRFFGDPEKFLELVVAAAEKKTSVGKATFAIRQKVREEAEKSFESEWQAGEVSGKRKHWRQSILNLREGWILYQNSKKAAETDDKRLGKEQAASAESSQVVENAAQQKPDTQESGTDVAMPLAVPVVSASEQEQQGKGKGKETADVSHQDSQKAQSQLSDLQLHLLPISTQGNEPGGSTSVDNVVALAQSLTGNVDSEVQQRLLQAQREGEEPIQASEAKSPALWLDRIINPSGHAATASASTANHGAAHQLLLSGPQLPIAPFNPKEDEPGSPTITSSSNASPRREQQQQQQHRVSPPPQPSFGSSIQDPSTGTSGSTAELRDMLQPTETFGSGILYQNNHRQLHDGVDVSSNRSSSDAGSDSSAFVVDIVGPSPSPSSAAADQS